MTEEILKQGMSLMAKIRFAKDRVKHFMNAENFCKNIVKKEYFAGKVNEWTLKLDELRKQFKDL